MINSFKNSSENGLFYASGRLVHNFDLEYFHLNLSPAVAAYIFCNHGSGILPQLRLNTVWNDPQIPISQSATISAGLFHASRRLIHNFGLQYFQLNPSPAVAAYMFRNHDSKSRPQLRLNTA